MLNNTKLNQSWSKSLVVKISLNRCICFTRLFTPTSRGPNDTSLPSSLRCQKWNIKRCVKGFSDPPKKPAKTSQENNNSWEGSRKKSFSRGFHHGWKILCQGSLESKNWILNVQNNSATLLGKKIHLSINTLNNCKLIRAVLEFHFSKTTSFRQWSEVCLFSHSKSDLYYKTKWSKWSKCQFFRFHKPQLQTISAPFYSNKRWAKTGGGKQGTK